MKTTTLTLSCLPYYEWLDVPAWVFDAQRMCVTWANPAGCAYWHASHLQELISRDYADASESVRTRLDLTMQAHARGEVLRESWTLYPKGKPITSMLVSRAIALDDGSHALLFVAERLPPAVDADTLRGVEAVQHTTVRISLHSLPSGATLMRNPAAAQAFGPLLATSTKRVRGAFEAMFPDPDVAARILAQARNGQTFGAELELQTLQGLRWHAVDVRPVRDPVSGKKAMQFNARDIGDLKAVQKALETARVAADNANLAKSAFLANVSHEIRTPMNGVLGLTELVLRTELNDKQRQYIHLAHQSAQSLMVIINDLLDVAKIESGRIVIEQRPFSLAQCITEALSPLQLTASNKKLRLTWYVPPQVPDALVGDDARIRQVLINLVGNALKFTQAGEVQVAVEQLHEPELASADGAVVLRLSVRDTGIGMTPEQLACVFEPFSQADSSITRRYGGTGLGLTIVARLVGLMGGEVHVTSTPDQGSCFSFTLRVMQR
jgi:signal transduction histidine kinase